MIIFILGAVGAVAFGIGTSEVEMVMASQCILQAKPKTMRICVEGIIPSFTSLTLRTFVDCNKIYWT